jgi:hypothetical protein
MHRYSNIIGRPVIAKVAFSTNGFVIANNSPHKLNKKL